MKAGGNSGGIPMTGRVLPFDSSTHAAVDAFLPFYVNGTLGGDELALVERHLHGCQRCRQEADWLRELFAACVANSLLQETPSATPASPQDLPARRRLRAFAERIRE